MNINRIENIIKAIRGKVADRKFRFDADEGEQPNQNNKAKKSGLGTRLPYALCKDLGIDTSGMTPREAWDAYYGKTGVEPKKAIEDKIKSKSGKIDPNGGKGEGSSEVIEEAKEKTPEQEKEDIRKKFIDEVGYAPDDDVWKEFWGLGGDTTGTFYELDLPEDIENELEEGYKRYMELSEEKEEEPEREKTVEELEKEYNDALAEWTVAKYETKGSDTPKDKVRRIAAKSKYWRLADELGEAKVRESVKKEEKEVEEEEKKKAKSIKDELKATRAEIKRLEKIVNDINSKATTIGAEISEDEWIEAQNAAVDLHKLRGRLEELQAQQDKAKLKDRMTKEVPKGKEVNFDYKSDLMKAYAQKAPKPIMATEIKSLKGWSERASEWADYSAEVNEDVLWSEDPEDLVKIRDGLQKVFDNGELCCNVNGEYLQSIVTDHLMNQFESKHTGGSDDLGARRSAAENLFGLGKSSAIDKEKYGYIADKGDFDYTLGRYGPGYGYNGNGSQCCLVFRKDTMAQRTTYTADDSLYLACGWNKESYAAGAVDTNCSLEGLSYSKPLSDGLKNGTITSISQMVRNYKENTGFTSYIETQMHGDVGGRDIEEIRFNGLHSMKTDVAKWSDEMWKAMSDFGIKIGYFDDDKKLTTMSAEEARKKAFEKTVI